MSSRETFENEWDENHKDNQPKRVICKTVTTLLDIDDDISIEELNARADLFKASSRWQDNYIIKLMVNRPNGYEMANLTLDVVCLVPNKSFQAELTAFNKQKEQWVNGRLEHELQQRLTEATSSKRKHADNLVKKIVRLESLLLKQALPEERRSILQSQYNTLTKEYVLVLRTMSVEDQDDTERKFSERLAKMKVVT